MHPWPAILWAKPELLRRRSRNLRVGYFLFRHHQSREVVRRIGHHKCCLSTAGCGGRRATRGAAAHPRRSSSSRCVKRLRCGTVCVGVGRRERKVEKLCGALLRPSATRRRCFVPRGCVPSCWTPLAQLTADESAHVVPQSRLLLQHCRGSPFFCATPFVAGVACRCAHTIAGRIAWAADDDSLLASWRILSRNWRSATRPWQVQCCHVGPRLTAMRLQLMSSLCH